MFQIAELPLLSGHVGLCPLPGRDGDYKEDLQVLFAWRPDIVLTLVSDIELEAVDAEGLSADLSRAGIAWRHLPVCNFSAPLPGTAAAWDEASARARAILAAGGRVLVHCYGGCGRAGMAALRLMVDAGEAPEAALPRLRAEKPCAVESVSQYVWAGGDPDDWCLRPQIAAQ